MLASMQLFLSFPLFFVVDILVWNPSIFRKKKVREANNEPTTNEETETKEEDEAAYAYLSLDQEVLIDLLSLSVSACILSSANSCIIVVD